MLDEKELSQALQLLNQLTATHTHAAFCTEETASILRRGLERQRTRGHGRDVVAVRPFLDSESFTVHWNRKSCDLGNTNSFRLLQRLCTRPDHYVSHEALKQDVWHGDSKEAETIRSAIRQLKRKLIQAGMNDLATAIRSRSGHYGLILRMSR